MSLHRQSTAFAAILLLLAAAAPAIAREAIPVATSLSPGQIIISQRARRLYFTIGNGWAISYIVAVAKPGKEWRGAARIDGKYVSPAWAPPDSVKRDHPELPDLIPGGSPRNPMGVRALTLDRDEIAIHGTNRPESIGKAVSYGCIRMSNTDVTDLFQRVAVGTLVTMVP